MQEVYWVMTGFGIFFAVSAPVVLVKAVRRKEWQRLYELVVMTLFTSGCLLTALWPTVTQNAWAAWPPLRWLWSLSSLLFLANFLAFLDGCLTAIENGRFERA